MANRAVPQFGRPANGAVRQAVYLLPRHGEPCTALRPTNRETELPPTGTPLRAIFDCATALERADASSRVLAARSAGHAGAPRAFAELAAIAPDGLIPTVGRGAAHVARQLERAADLAAEARGQLGDEVVDAMEWAAGMIRRIASTSDGLDPGGAARAARRGVASVRGLVDGTVDRDERWEAFRLGSFLPRAAWLAALVRAAIAVNETARNDDADRVAAAVAGTRSDGDVLRRLLEDRVAAVSVARSLGEVEAALVVLHRGGHVGSAALPLAREAQARLRVTRDTDLVHGAEPVDMLLDGVGALVGAIDPPVAEPGTSPFPGLRRPSPPSGPASYAKSA